MTANAGRPNRARRLVFAAIMACLIAGSLELMGRGAYRVIYGQPYSSKHLTELAWPFEWERLAAAEGAAGGGRKWKSQILHPYLGFVADKPDPESHGLSSSVPLLQRRNPARLVVAVSGGSVAAQLTGRIQELLRDRLEVPASGVEVVVVGLSMAGFKQPQQLIAVSYLLSLGGHLDLLINIDGYNEIVLPAKDNYTDHTFPFFPRGWKTRLQMRSTTSDLVQIGKLAFLRDRRDRLVNDAGKSVWRHTAAFGLIRAWQIHSLSREATRIDSELAGTHGESGTLETDGPYRVYAGLDELLSDSARVWQRSSLLLHRLAAGVGFEYFHFLQPNQYVDGSKVPTRKELRDAWEPDHLRAKYVRQGYPHLIRAGHDLAEAGVRYYDLTMLFRDRAETLYLDVCCHYNERGVDLVARRVVETVLRETTDARLRL